MIREIRYKISEDTKSIEPKTRQWAGMQYEDNATEVVFDLSELGFTNALYRIDFSSAGAGYRPSENLAIKDGCLHRKIPKYLTQYGGELEAVAVITPLGSEDEPTGEVLSYPTVLYFTPVSRGDEGEAEFIPSLSAMEESVRKIQEAASEDAAAAERARLEIENAGVSAEALLNAKYKAEALICEVEEKLQNGSFVGEKGEPGEAGQDALTDQSYTPTSTNAQSGRAVAEAVEQKANLQFKTLDIEEIMNLSGLKEGAHIYELKEVSEWGTPNAYELYFTDGTRLWVSTHESLKIGKKYLILTTLDPEGDYIFDIVAECIDLEDKVNIADIDQSYNPESPNAQSGRAVAEAVATKANLEFKDITANLNIEYNGGFTNTTFTDIMTLGSCDDMGYGIDLFFVSVNSNEYAAFTVYGSSKEELENDGFKVGDKYRVSVTNNSVDSIEKVIDLKDKVNTTDFAEALANVGGKPVKLLSAAITQEAFDAAGENGIKIVTVGDENINLAPYSEILVLLSVPKYEGLNEEAGKLACYLTETEQYSSSGKNELLKTQSTAISTACGINNSNASGFVIRAVFAEDTFLYGEVIKNGYGNSCGYAGVTNGWTCVSSSFTKRNKKYVHINGSTFKFPVGTTVEVYGR